MRYPLSMIEKAALAVEHIHKVVVVAVYFVEHREYSAEDCIVAPVEHIACVGAYLVVA